MDKKDRTRVQVIYCKHAFDGQKIDGLYLLPLPTRPNSNATNHRLVAPVTKEQSNRLDTFCKKNGYMGVDALFQIIDIFMKETNQ
jgi:hypothetical protein